MSDRQALELLRLLAMYATEYGADSASMETLTVADLASDLAHSFEQDTLDRADALTLAAQIGLS